MFRMFRCQVPAPNDPFTPFDRSNSLAYIIVLRTFPTPSFNLQHLATTSSGATESNVKRIRSTLNTLVPFVMDSKSKYRATSARDAWQVVWDAWGQLSNDPLRQGVSDLVHRDIALTVVLQDAAILCTLPLDVTKSWPISLVFSDMHAILASPVPSNSKSGGVLKKLEFYYAAAKAIPRSEWCELRDQVVSEGSQVQIESEEVEDY